MISSSQEAPLSNDMCAQCCHELERPGLGARGEAFPLVLPHGCKAYKILNLWLCAMHVGSRKSYSTSPKPR